jgi:peroxiredoxin
VTSHQNYCSKKGFTFPILSDPNGAIVEKYKCTKSITGGVARTVYAINPESKFIFAERGMADYNDIMKVIKDSQ